MGYESRFYAVKKYYFESSIKGKSASEIVAELDMSKMGYDSRICEFRDLFKNEADFTLHLLEYDDELGGYNYKDVTKDAYGAELCYIAKEDIPKAIKLINNQIRYDSYWRFKLLRDFLKMFKDCDNIYIVHYGY